MKNLIKKTIASTLLFLLIAPEHGHSLKKTEGSIGNLFTHLSGSDTSPRNYSYQIINEYPHNPSFFTQGLVYINGELIESTGQYGRSSVNRIAIETGKTLQKTHLSSSYFGEGLTVLNNKIIQLTWQSGKGFVYDLSSFSVLNEFSFPSEGWGLTHNEKNLIASDGTATLYFLDPDSLKVLFKKEVKEDQRSVTRINELEYIKGKILANIWGTDKIAIIDSNTAKITGWLDLTGLLPLNLKTKHVNVLNGIAYDEKNDRLFVTGKYWPRIFEIKIIALLQKKR